MTHLKRISKGKHLIECDICGEQAVRSSKQIRTCSDKCRGILISRVAQGLEPKKEKKARVGLVCRVCGDPIPEDSQKEIYCSDLCYQWGRRHDKEFTCEQCGKTYLAHKPTSKYCSYECAAKASEVRKHRWYTCEQCGVEFNPETKDRKYCSYECMGLAERKPWAQLSSSMKEYRGSERWTKVRAKILKRDKKTCQICGHKHGFLKKVHVHHIIPLGKFFPDDLEASEKPSNLITLCSTCHPKVEHGQIECPKPKA